MKKCLALLLALCLSLAALSGCAAAADEYTKYSSSFFGTFDTVVILIGYAKEEAAYDRAAQEVRAQFERLHRVFDGYSGYKDVRNLYYLNREAPAGRPVAVEPELMALLQYCKAMQPQTRGTVNVALGAALSLWHDAREALEATGDAADLPKIEALARAAEHANLDDVLLDPDTNTVTFLDPALRLDLGAVAKGYAAELVAQWLLASEMPSFILSAGGNVRVGMPPLDGRASWVVSVQDPGSLDSFDPGTGYVELLYVNNTSVVTSGDYQRYVLIDGVRYHHLISPDTLMPAAFVRAVTIVTEDSGYADLLSTAAFLMPYEESRAFIDALEGVEALWVLTDDSLVMTDGLKPLAGSQR
ncbi:FAD:protein FMN transferase [Clostridia bacterium]|nr:FAD:protein FMN transferase [Clostridia bacterium]